MKVVVFEDEAVSRLHPISLARPAYAITCGSFRLIDWLVELGGVVHGLVRPHLAQIQRVDFADQVRDAVTDGLSEGGEPTLWVNARLVPSVDVFRQLQRLVAEPRSGAVLHGSTVLAAWFAGGDQLTLPPLPAGVGSSGGIGAWMAQAGVSRLPGLPYELPCFVYPHDVIRFNMEILGANLEYRLSRGGYRELQPGFFAADGVSVSSLIETNTRSGPIVLEAGVSVGPFCFLRGPVYLGRGAKVIEHAAIKDAVSVGHTTKIGGEVEAAVIEPFTNKQHHGFLGHSYLGSWINLGAGTCNSDLKNTYGKVNLEYRGEKVNTGMQFVGCMMGDYSKTAINTGIFTGKVIGACSMLYGFVTTNVPSFVNYARLFGQVTELPPEVMVASQSRMFQRRQVNQRPCDVQLIHDLYELTRDERQQASEPLSL